MKSIEKSKDIFKKVSTLIEEAKKKVAITINEEMIILYWNVGKIIKKEIIKNERAEYGMQIVSSLSQKLSARYGKGFSKSNLWYMVQLYENFPILQSVIGEFKNLSWTHIISLLPLKDELKRKFYSTICQVVIDLKLGKFQAEYKGQMELYLKYLEKYEMSRDENLPIGIILCSEKGKEKIELLFSPVDKIKVSEYLTNLPSKKMLAEKLSKAVKSAQLKLPRGK
jgi:hypothetical protein